MSMAGVRSLDEFLNTRLSDYRAGHKIISRRAQCSCCGTFVGLSDSVCHNPKCGADLR